MIDRRDRPTPRDPLPTVKPPRQAQVAPGLRFEEDDSQRVKREAASALRKVSALPPASQDVGTAISEALRRRAEAAEAKLAERDRQERVAREIQGPAQYPPVVISSNPPAANSAGTQGRTGERGRTGEQGAPASKLAQLPAILLGAAALVTAIATAVRPAPDTKAAESYTALRDELVKQNAAIRENGASDELRWQFALGLFTAQGVKVTPQPGTPKPEPLAIEPAPLSHKISPSSAQAIQVRDPLPPPVPSVAPVKLPKDLASLPTKAIP